MTRHQKPVSESVSRYRTSCKYLQRGSLANCGLHARRAGFSLIEIVISLAIFVFGALAIVRIFPRALGVVQNSEQRAIGQRMAQSTITQYQNNPLSVPDTVMEFDAGYVNDENKYGWSDFPGAVFGTRLINNSLPSDPPSENDLTVTTSTPIRETSLGRFRRVVGESHVIKNGEVLLRFPYVPNAGTVTRSIVYKVRHNVSGVVLDANGQLDFSSATLSDSSAFNEGATAPTRPPLNHPLYKLPDNTTTPRENVVFYVSYSWREGNITRSVKDEPKVFLDPAVISYAVGANGARPLQLSTSVTGRAPVAGPVSVWFYQPYSATATNQGTGTFNPALGRLVFDAADEGKRVFVDYTVRDWRALVVDTNLSTRLSENDNTYLNDNGITTVPAQARQVVVPTRYIADESVANAAQAVTLLSGTINNGGTVQKAVSIRNAWLPDNTIQPDPDSPATQTAKAIGVRPKTGQIFFDTTYTNPAVTPNTQALASPFARVVYVNRDGWSQQVSVAARDYLPYVAGITAGSVDRRSFPREGWREYVGNGTGVMIFHPSEAGKTFEVSYTYTVGGVTRTMNGVQVTSEREVQNATDFPPPAGFLQNYKTAAGADATNDKVAIAYLPDASGLKIGAPVNEGGVAGTINAIHSVKGVSLRVRSAWYEGSGYTQASVVGYRPLDVERWARN